MQTTSEQRRWPRATLPAYAIVSSETMTSTRYDVFNMCAGGALLTCGPALEAGTVVRLSLLLPEPPAIQLEGRVLRTQALEPGEVAVAIAFEHDTPDTEDAIHQAVLAFLEAGGELV